MYLEPLNQWRQAAQNKHPHMKLLNIYAAMPLTKSSLLQYGIKKIKHMPYDRQHQYFFLGRFVWL